ncbi:MAG: hypothetical protein K8R64_04880 [Methanosarcinaceae archaeon]|nr:hypothetical protein [Methanosarcinaceae archaeon]
MDLLLVLAMGIPDEDILIDTVVNEDIRYWRDEHDVHHVPKRRLDDICIRPFTLEHEIEDISSV